MRISSVLLRNYKGLRHVELSDLASEPIIAVSGRNGTGKSLVLEALAAAWNERLFDPAQLVGPWGDEAQIRIEMQLSPDESKALAEFEKREHDEGKVLVVCTDRTFTIRGDQRADDSLEMSTLRNAVFRQAHPYAVLDFLPASRHVPARQAATIDPELFGERRTQEERMNNLDNFLQSRAVTEFPGVKSFLATLHYLDMLNNNQGVDSDGFHSVVKVFEGATGKRIEEPVVDVETGAAIRVTTRSGIQHDLDGLSSGEKEALALLYFLRRVNSRGGVLLVDEPEQHLHPALQASFFTTALGLTERAQLLIVTHSPKLLALAPSSALLRIQDAADCEANQAGRASDWPAKESLFADIGLTAIDLVHTTLSRWLKESRTSPGCLPWLRSQWPARVW